jgi:phosphate transport system protein
MSLIQRDAESAVELQREDDALDRLNRQVFEATYALNGNHGERELAMRYVLIARSLERIGDNAVDIAEQAVFLVTGQRQELNDASRPKPRRDHDPVDR